MFVITGCSGRQDIGEWMPFTEDISSEKLGKKFGVPDKNHVLDGLTFWELSPLVYQAPYAFQWDKNRVSVWVPNGENISRYNLEVENCPGLAEQMDSLLDSIGESARLMMADKERDRTGVFLGSPVWYRVKYYPPDMLGSVTLNNIEFFQAPWISKAKEVKEIINKCIKDKG